MNIRALEVLDIHYLQERIDFEVRLAHERCNFFVYIDFRASSKN